MGLKKQGVEVWLPWSKIFLTKGCRLIVCQVQNADLIAVSLACPKDPTSPYRMHMGPPRESSVRNLLEKVGNLRDIAVLVQLNLAFLTFIDLHLRSQIVSDYHPLFLNGLFQFNFFGCNGAVPYSQGAPKKINVIFTIFPSEWVINSLKYIFFLF